MKVLEEWTLRCFCGFLLLFGIGYMQIICVSEKIKYKFGWKLVLWAK